MAHEEKVARVDDLHDGQMTKVTVGETDVLLLKNEGQVRAYGGVCPHHGAPLEEGSLCEGRVLCPWHLSVFDAMDGSLVEPPTLDGLARFDVRTHNGDIYVSVPEKARTARRPEMTRPDSTVDGRLFAIIGSGAAGTMAAQTLREEGYAGRIVMISDDARLPYDRTDCSKGFMSGKKPAEKLYLRSESFYEQFGIERLHARVAGFDVRTRAIELDTREEIDPDCVLVAAGGEPRRLGPDLMGRENVYTLRSMDDAEAIISAGEPGQRAVLVGASFICMEVAASLRKREVEVTVVAPESTPFEGVLGQQVGLWLQGQHEENGVRFALGRQVLEVAGPAGRVAEVVLTDGGRLPADVVVVGIGVAPRTAFIRNAAKAPDESIRVDSHLSCGRGVYVAGDIAHYPDPRTGEGARVEHWRLAQQQGRTAARNMAGRRESFRGVPFFWSVQGQTKFSYVGYVPRWDEVAIDGDVAGGDFTAYYVNRGRALACAGTRMRAVHAMHELYAQPSVPSLAVLREAHFDPWALLERAGVR